MSAFAATSRPPAAASANDSLPESLSCVPLQMLTRIARQSRIGDPDGCAAIFALLTTSRMVRGHLQKALTLLGLSEIKFFTLISLYACDPDPCTPAELARQSRVSRATMSDTIEALRDRGWIDRVSSESDRRKRHIRLTPPGRSTVERAVRPFLTLIGRCSATLTSAEHRALTRSCAQLCDHFQPSA